ncbi:hypothetical protein DdX_11604 [Ditylenchus destructor]|uniref:Uncharacterized protein n=1 Tax=Ditylenchus destructor TaxID=166010 RepID=A0AAD4N1W5_9BILA|nr:hypothetical protein DdX_11604 [Ditylenchus destructor]
MCVNKAPYEQRSIWDVEKEIANRKSLHMGTRNCSLIRLGWLPAVKKRDARSGNRLDHSGCPRAAVHRGSGWRERCDG